VARQIEELAAFVATTTWEDVPTSVQHHPKLVLLDTLGVILAGAERPEVRRLREQLGTGSGATVYAGGFPSHDPRTAAPLNGIAGRSIELCEGLRLVSGQAAMQVLPGCWRSASRKAAAAATCWPLCCSATTSPPGSPADSRRDPWPIRTGRCRCWRPQPPEQGCSASIPVG